MGVPIPAAVARMDNDHIDLDEGMLFNEEGPRGGPVHSEDSEADDRAQGSSDSDELDMDHDDRGMAIVGATSESEKSSTLRASLEERGLPPASPSVPVPHLPPKYNRPSGGIAASMPARVSTSKLGTSAPIAIPNMARWRPNGGSSDEEGRPREVASTFVPPHQLSRQEDFLFSFTGASPAGALKRERLRTRNAILRSTGFLEPSPGAAAAAVAAVASAAAPVVAPAPPRVVSHSTLTAALSTIGEL